MSALWKGRAQPVVWPQLRQMTTRLLDAVMAIETAVYPFPWTRGNFIDSLAAGYDAQVLVDVDGGVLGYFVAMAGVDEMHLLNITVAPPMQGQRHARRMFDALLDACRRRGAEKLWLEVRESNARGRAVYLHLGFLHVGVRKGYYPAAEGRREDAMVMSLAVPRAAPDNDDALD